MTVFVAVSGRNGNLVTREWLVDAVRGQPTADSPIDRGVMLIRRARS